VNLPPGTWYWTEAQIQADLDDPGEEAEGEEIRPRADRKNEIIQLGKSKVEVRAQLRAEGFTDEWSETIENGQRVVSFPAVEEDV